MTNDKEKAYRGFTDADVAIARLAMAQLEAAKRDLALRPENATEEELLRWARKQQIGMREEAYEWFADQSGERHSFNWVCDVLGINADALRVELFYD